MVFNPRPVYLWTILGLTPLIFFCVVVVVVVLMIDFTSDFTSRVVLLLVVAGAPRDCFNDDAAVSTFLI